MSPAQAATLSGKTTESSDSILTWLESIDVDPITTPSAIFSVVETVLSAFCLVCLRYGVQHWRYVLL